MKKSHAFAIAYGHIAVYIISALLLLHVLMAGRVWWWNIFSFLPTWCWLAVPIFALLMFALRPKNFLTLASVLLTLPLALAQSDIQFFPHPNTLPADIQAVRVITWNSLGWRQSDRTAWKTYLGQMQGADVVMLQELIRPRTWDTPPAEENADLFPGYRVLSYGEWVTATTLPVVGVFAAKDQYWLRVDVDIQGKRVSLYNVHIPVHINPAQMLRDPPGFFADLKERHTLRTEQFRLLERELRGNSYPKIIAGDFNSTKSMGTMGYFLDQYTDMARVGSTWFPATWGDMGIHLWRIDWMLISKEFLPIEQRQAQSTELSDHRALSATIGIPH
ncbi:hypothetical protein COW46_01925 [Candidatus Gracilibacteria bacterium CG17_big_fil_post_rev_8_21_14_2_50_48_13]|nr:MAG: hypothetical protein COW46_01925 [Candidatus Gracilibacteria bacterium CG17_big_fil_post_rev_8_21_14_2_50_48_13]